ncbi:MAG TPA: hypothetical protein VNH83_16645 [Bryobacteraceae bacterium]|nr:hypothetical protein [Bryobacteraceae bacterium]
MSFSEMPWPTASVFLLGALLIAGGVIAFIAGLVHEEKKRRRELRRFDARVGRDVYRDVRGLTK